MPFLSASGVSPYNKIRGGGSAFVAPYNFGNALEFDGANDFLSGASLNSSTSNNIILSTWFKTSNTGSSLYVKNPILGEAGGWLCSIGINNGKVAAMHYNGSRVMEQGTTTVADGQWHHMLCLIKKGSPNAYQGNITIWLDGVIELNEADYSVRSVDTDYKFVKIGSMNADRFEGVLDEFGYKAGVGITATTANAVSLYNSGNGVDTSEVIASLEQHYHFNETTTATTAVDSSGNGNNATLNNFTLPGAWVPHTPFAFGNALKFDGVNDNVTFTSTSSVGDISLSFWIRTTGGSMYFWGKDISSYIQFLTSNRIRLNNSGIGDHSFTKITYGDNNWHNIAILNTGTNIRLYADGQFEASASSVNYPSDTLGKNPTQTSDFYNGIVDQVVQANTAFASDAVADAAATAIYNNGSGQKPENIFTGTKLVYELNETGTATTAVDSSGNGNNGTLNNFALPGAWVPFVSGGTSDSAAIIARMSTNGSTPSQKRQVIINQLVLDLKGIGNTGSADIWSILDVMQIYAAEDSIQAKTEWIKADGSLDATEVNAPTFAANVGYTATSTGSIDTNYQPTDDGVNYALNSASVGVYIIVGANLYFTGIDENPNRIWIRNDDDGSIDAALNSSFNSVGSFSKEENYLATITRSNSSQFKLWTDNSLSATKTAASTAIPSNYTVRFLGVNRASPIVSNGARGSLFFAGGDLSPYVTQLSNSFNAYLNSI